MNSNSLFKKIELLANASIVVVALLLSLVLVKSYLLANSSPPSPRREADSQEVRIGQAIALHDVDWAKNRQTLILALSTTCHFCTESGPFYQRLAKERGSTRLITVFPQDVSEGQRYLARLGVNVDEVRQVVLSSLGISGTPTLILLDSSGRVVETWIGALPADEENGVLNRLRENRASR